MSAALSPASAAAEDAPLPIRTRLLRRAPAFVVGLGMVIYPTLQILDRMIMGRTLYPEFVIGMALSALPSLWFFAIALMPTAYLYRDRLVASKLFLGRAVRFESEPRIEDGVLVINGKAHIFRFAVEDEVWDAIKARFGR